MKQAVWFDVSHIMGWSGNLTGIERVEYHLIKYYFEKTDAGFVVWDNKRQRFSVASRTLIEAVIINRTSEQEFKQDKPDGLLKRIKRRLSLSQSFVNRGDVFIVPAGLWDNQTYIEGLKAVAVDNHLIHVVHDMIPINQSQYIVDYLPPVFEKYMREVLPVCYRLMANSQSTARDTRQVLKERKLHVPPIKVFRLGDDITRADKAVAPAGLTGDFILSVGTIEARKNHALLYGVQRLALAKNLPIPKMVIAGRRGWLTDNLQNKLETDTSIRDRIIILDKTTDAELRWLYRNCLFTIFPSFYEGWGIPVAESLGYGKVTLSSSASSMPEIGGRLVDYFSPKSAEELLKLIIKYSDKKTRQTREKLIAKNYKPLSWDRAAAEFARLAIE